jgi:chemotaxis protein MotB
VQLRELDALRRNVETLTILRRELEAKLAEQGTEVEKGKQALSEERKLTDDAKARADLLTRQINALQQQLAALNEVLGASEKKSQEQQVQIADLGRRLNLALASRVEELARYRSEFFGRLRQILGERSDIRIVGDRFVFQAEILFAAGSAELEPAGRAQIARVADALKEITAKIPPEINWVLQVDGHTDRRPILTAQFPSNWELSAARAISVVKFLMSQGVPAERLSAAGFAEFAPIDSRDDEIGWRRNRRIELKLTNR